MFKMESMVLWGVPLRGPQTQVDRGESISTGTGQLRQDMEIYRKAPEDMTLEQRRMIERSDDGNLSRFGIAIDARLQIRLVAVEGTVCLSAHFLTQHMQRTALYAAK